jgi:Na+-transporting NADH:ubiquinone oxidoreductase subunit NqrC
MYDLMSTSIDERLAGAMFTDQLGIAGMDITAFDKFKAMFNDPATVDALDEMFGGGMLGLTENAELQQKLAEALVDPAIELTDEQRRQLEITQALLDLQEQQLVLEQKAAEESHRKSTEEARMLKIKQEENLLDMRATEEQKALLDVQRQMMSHVGIDSTGLVDMSAAQEQASIEFLNAYAGMLENSLKDMQSTAFPQAQGNLEQDAFKAQAQAFDEVMKAASKKPDPQIEKTNKKLEEIREAIANGGVLRIVQQ